MDTPSTRTRFSWPVLIGLAGIAIAACYSGIAKLSVQSVDPSNYALRAENILKTTPLIDGHNDLPYLLRLELQNKIYNDSAFTFRNGN